MTTTLSLFTWWVVLLVVARIPRMLRWAGARLDAWVLSVEQSSARKIPAGPEVGCIDDEGSFCTGEPTEVASVDLRSFISKPKTSSPVADWEQSQRQLNSYLRASFPTGQDQRWPGDVGPASLANTYDRTDADVAEEDRR